MADVITRFRLETTQYDSKLRDASRELAEYAREAEKAGKDFSDFSKEQVEAAQSLGKIATSANNAKDKVGELVNAYNTVAKAYNKLTEQQRESDYGKAMAESLNTLKGRIGEAKRELNDLGDSAKGAGGILGELSKRFTVNIDALKLFDIGLKAAKGALDIAKDAFFANEQNLDEWGRTVTSCESLYKGFLIALNTGDISGYLKNMSSIVQAARGAYDALDTLNTFNAFNKINTAKARTKFHESINDYRENQGAPYADYKLKLAATAYKNELAVRRVLEQRAYEGEILRLAQLHGVNAQDLKDALSGTYGNYMALKNLPLSGTRTTQVNTGGTYTNGPTYSTVTEHYAANKAERLGQALRMINDQGALDYVQSLGEKAQSTADEIAGVNRQLNRIMRGANTAAGSNVGSGGGGGKGGTSTTIPVVEKIKTEVTSSFTELQILQDALKTVENSMSPYGKASDEWKEMNEYAESLRQKIKELNGELEELPETPTEEKEEPKKVDTTKAVSELVGSVSTIVSSLNQLGIDVPKGFSNMLSGLQTVITILEAIQTIETVGNILGIFHNGGIVPHAANGYFVPGTHYSNDVTPVLANAGELILSKSQQGNLASQLSGGQGGYAVQPYVNGEMILLGTNNHLRRSGQGEIVTTRMLRSYGLIN